MKAYVPRMTRIGWLVAAVSLPVAAACSSCATTQPASHPTTPPPSATTVSTLVHRTFMGAGQHPTVTEEVPAPSSWTPYNVFGLTSDSAGASRGIGLWDVGKVARDPCHPIGHLYDPGPTVDDLVGALEAQPMRHATAPTDVTLAGYSGKYLEWSVPATLVVTGDGDFAGCDVQGDGHRNFVSWDGNGGEGERWQQMAGQVDQLWILDVNGQRLVVDAMHSPNATQAQVDEEDRIVASLRFLPAT